MSSYDYSSGNDELASYLSSTQPQYLTHHHQHQQQQQQLPHHGNNQATMDSDSFDSCDISAVSIMTDLSHEQALYNGVNHPGLIYTYEVRFKTCCEQYLYHEKLTIGEMVTVQCERGYNIGFIDGEVLSDPENPPQKRILAKLLDEDNTIKDMLKFKITAEKNALTQCRMHCKGHRLGNFADSIAAEFQFDRKKLTVYLKKYEDVSVCRLVRKLYDTYKMRIKVLEVDDAETMKEMTMKYLELSKLNIPLSEAYNFDPTTSVISLKNQGKQNKTDKHPPNFSKSHLGQSQHLIPSLVQYGPQAEKRHNTPVYHQNLFSNTTSNISQPPRSDRNYEYHHQQPQQHHNYGQAYDSKYPQRHTALSAAVPHAYNGSRNQVSQLQHHQMPWSSTNVAQQKQLQQQQQNPHRNNSYGLDRQFDKFSIHDNRHHSLEPFGHDDSADDAYRYQSNNYQYPGNYNETFYGEHEDYIYSTSRMDGYRNHYHTGYENIAPNDLDVLTTALSRPCMEPGHTSNSSLSSSNLSSPTNSITSIQQSQNAQSIFRYPEISF